MIAAALSAATVAVGIALARAFGTADRLWGERPKVVRLVPQVGGALAAIPPVVAPVGMLP